MRQRLGISSDTFVAHRCLLLGLKLGLILEIVYRIFRSLDVCATSAVTDFYKRVEKRPIRPIFRVKILLYHGAVWTSETPKCTSMYSLSASLSSQYNEG